MVTADYPFDYNKLVEVFRQNDVCKAGLFGSMSRGEGTAESDVDLLVEFSKRKSLLAMVALEREISAAIGRKVDLLTEAALSPYLRDRILREVKVIYEAGSMHGEKPVKSGKPRETGLRNLLTNA